jgi:hypothetical protein
LTMLGNRANNAFAQFDRYKAEIDLPAICRLRNERLLHIVPKPNYTSTAWQKFLCGLKCGKYRGYDHESPVT